MKGLRTALSASLLCLVFAAPLAGQAGPSGNDVESRLSAAEWRDDLHYLAAQMRLKHKSLFHSMSEVAFAKAVKDLDAEIPRLNDDQIFVRMAQLVAMVEDGHSGLDLRPLPPAEEKDHIPLRFARYADGIYIRAAAPEYAAAVGGKVIKVGSVGWQEAIQRLDAIESHDPGNDGEQLAWSAKTSLNCPRLLYGLSLSSSRESVDYVIEKGRQSRTFTMKASATIGEWYLNSVPEGWVDARPSSVPVPLSRQHENLHFWFTTLTEQHAVYFQFNLVRNGEEESLADFTKRLATALDQPDVQRLVVDLRNNTGGDNTLLHPLLVALIRSKVNRRGGLFIITGPTTFSAAQNFVNRMESYTEAIFVGEPTGENVNFYGDPAGITLPHSHLEAAVSQLWWQDKDPRDRRTATFPEIAIVPTFQDYVSGNDPVLQYALTAAAPETIQDALAASLPEGPEAALARYQGFVGDPTHRYLPDPEPQVNAFGYKLLAAKRIPEAILIFEVNVRAHPKSWNAYDSLGEAYVAAQDAVRALAAYRKSLELNPENGNGRRMIELIENAK
ncbi:MAG TPA: hypothetical protein VI488_04255 [Candidatus Angelobacter sp.]